MKNTEAESADLKQRFKAYFDAHGINATLTAELDFERQHYPLEWAEACHEWENKL